MRGPGTAPLPGPRRGFGWSTKAERSMPDEVIGKLHLPRPTWRVIRCGFDQLERETRKRTDYDLAHVTQGGDVYTLFFRLKPEYRAPRNGEHLLQEA